MHPIQHNHICPDLATVGALAQRAGEVTLTFFRRSVGFSDKGNDLGIVTEADLASEKLIKETISRSFPGHAILAEESGLTEGASGPETPIWIIDPLDGTTNFSKGNPYYCVSVAFGIRRGNSCELLMGAIHHPPTGDLYTAEKGKGAFVNGIPMKVSPLEDLSLSSFCTGFSSNKGARLKRVVDTIYAFQNQTLGTRINGAAALDLALTARGIFQGFFERRLNPWDMAAGVVMLAEAGATVTDMEGNPFDPLNSVDICAANAPLHARMLNIIAGVPSSDL